MRKTCFHLRKNIKHVFPLRIYTFNNVSMVEPGPAPGPVRAQSLRDVWIKRNKNNNVKNIKVKMINDSTSYKLHPKNNVSMLTSLLTWTLT